MANEEGLTPLKAQELKEAFILFDRNNDNRISTEELGCVIRGLGMNPTDRLLKEVMCKFDKNKSGFIEYEEYEQLIENFMLTEQEVKVQLQQAFLYFDRDKNGILSIEELKNVLMSMGHPLEFEDTTYILKLADTNKDGKLVVKEFVDFLCEKV